MASCSLSETDSTVASAASEASAGAHAVSSFLPKQKLAATISGLNAKKKKIEDAVKNDKAVLVMRLDLRHAQAELENKKFDVKKIKNDLALEQISIQLKDATKKRQRQYMGY